MADKIKVAIGLGSNLHQPERQVCQALQALDELPCSRLLKVSSLYFSRPQGPADQPDYVNACAVLETQLVPLELLDALQAIEQRMGKVKKRHWGERIIDLDILLYDDQVIQSERLIVPHPWMHQRDFVLLPLAEIVPEWRIPGVGYVEDALAQLPETFVYKKDDLIK